MHGLPKGEGSEGIQFQVQDVSNRTVKATNVPARIIRYVVNEIKYPETIEGSSTSVSIPRENRRTPSPQSIADNFFGEFTDE